MNKTIKILSLVTALSLFAAVGNAQTNVTATNSPIATVNTNPPTSVIDALSLNPLSLLESYIVDNDTNYNGWLSNHFTLWQSAVFANIQGVTGASAIGNDLGLEVPIHKYNLAIDSTTRFEQLFGDVHSQQVGIQYVYNLNQLQLSAGLDGRYVFSGSSRLLAVPYVELKKASTLLHGVGTILRYGYPIAKGGAGEIEVGAEVSF